MNKKEYLSPKIIVTEAEYTFNLLGSNDPNGSIPVETSITDNRIRTKGLDDWEDDTDDFGW